MAASEVALDLVVTTGYRSGRTTQTGRGLLALVCDLSSCGGWKTGCLLNAPLLPDPWVWHPRIQPRRKRSFLLETFVSVTQTGGPEGHPDWSAGREHPVLLPMRGAWSPRPRLRRSETSERRVPVLRPGVHVTEDWWLRCRNCCRDCKRC